MTINYLTRELVRQGAKYLCEFIWTADGVRIVGITPTGRATCDRLDLNEDRYEEEDSIRAARRFWVRGDKHPPPDDARQGNI